MSIEVRITNGIYCRVWMEYDVRTYFSRWDCLNKDQETDKHSTLANVAIQTQYIAFVMSTFIAASVCINIFVPREYHVNAYNWCQLRCALHTQFTAVFEWSTMFVHTLPHGIVIKKTKRKTKTKIKKKEKKRHRQRPRHKQGRVYTA